MATCTSRRPLLSFRRCGSALVLAAIAPLHAAAADTVVLEGPLRLTYSADSLTFADPAFDDSEWRTAVAPISARRAGAPDDVDVIWNRITFTIPPDWNATHPAIRMGLVQRADETYLNGVLIGGEGVVGPLGSVWHNYPPVLPRLYAFEPDLLRRDGPNVLAVRVARQPFSDEAGLIAGPIALVDEHAALPEHFARLQRFQSIDIFIFGLESALLVVLIACLILGMRDRALLLFACIYAPYFIFRLEQRQFVHAWGFDTPALQFAATFLVSTIIVPMIAFVASVLQRPVGLAGRIIQIGSAVSLVSFPVASLAWTQWWRVQSILIWHVSLALALVLLFWWTVAAWRRGDPNASPLVVGLGVMAGTVIADLWLPSFASEVALGLRRGDMGILAFLLSLSFVAARRLVAIRRDLAATRSEALMAQEAERNRLARDVHDGIGQWLSAIKFKLEMLASGLSAAEPTVTRRAAQIVDDMDIVIEDTRRIAHDLSPVLLDQLGIVGAMKEHAARVVQNADVSIHVDGDAGIALTPIVRNNVYRFFQEALKNALSHSGGSHIEISLRRFGRDVVLTVEDDGAGLNSDRDGGLGLQSLRDRARLLDALLSIEASPAGGARITLRAPGRSGRSGL